MNHSRNEKQMNSLQKIVRTALNKHPLQRIKHNKPLKLRYGTSGIRSNHIHLHNAVLKSALFQIFQSLKKSQAFGIIITASHNPHQDNGIKLCDPKGGLIDSESEKIMENLINLESAETLDYLLKELHLEGISSLSKGTLFLGCDSRNHSDELCDLVRDLSEDLKEFVELKDFGYTSTPQLFTLVMQFNRMKKESNGKDNTIGNFGKNFYSVCLRDAFLQIIRITPDWRKKKVYVDCSNSVGSLILEEMNKDIKNALELIPYNKFREGLINEKCGSEFVHRKLGVPLNYPNEVISACLDGDADRLIYFQKTDQNIKIIDGDRMIALFAKYISLVKQKANDFISKLKIKVVLTSYSNGSLFDFVRSMGIEIAVAKTGIKNLSKQAETADIAIFFESNGHGSFYFSDDFNDEIKRHLDMKEYSSEAHEELECLFYLQKMCDTNYADSIAVLLIVEVIIQRLGIELMDLFGLYSDQPFKNGSVKVSNKNFIKRLSEDDSEVLDPVELQTEINSLTKNIDKSRCFVRPSGTEDLVRIYVEADTKENVEDLYDKLESIVIKYSE